MRILVASDLSEDGEVAIDVARAFRARHGGSIAIAHIVPPSTRPEMLFPQHNQPAVLDGVELQRRVGDHLRASIPDDLSDAKLIVEEGAPAERLLELAAERECDLIVLGGRDPGGKRMFGSVAEAVLANARIPVLIARQHRETGEILAATDLSEDGLLPVKRAAELALTRLARLTVVHVVPANQTQDTAALERVRKELPETARFEVDTGEPAAAIVAAAERHNAELIVVASHGRRGFARFVLGSVAARVVRKASCSVLVVPHHD